jgi:hypothetical protein
MFEIDTTPFPARRVVRSKYAEAFVQMRPGQCIKTDPKLVGSVAGAMRKWLLRNGRDDLVVRVINKLDDGYGRVYMMPAKPIKMADLPGRKVIKMGFESAGK